MLSSSQKNRKSLSPGAPKPRCDTGEADFGSPTRDVAAEQRADPHVGATVGAGSRVKAGTPSFTASTALLTPAWPLEDGLSQLRGCALLFSPRSEVSRAGSRTVNLTGFGLSCWHGSDTMSDEAAVLDGGEVLAREGALQTSPFPGAGAVSNVQGQKTQHPAGMGAGCLG